MHQGWPKFAANLWMATNDNGLAAVAYSPSIVNARVGKGQDVTIREETNYPFDGKVILRIATSATVKFPLVLRVPGWADSVTFSYRGKTKTGKAGSTMRFEERWKDGDIVTFNIPMKVRFETRYNNSLSLLRGPLYFSLRIDKEYKNVKINYDNYGYKGSADWEIYPKSPWNFGLAYDIINPARGFEVVENLIGKYPFADKGDMIWSADSGKYIVWRSDAAVLITARGIRIPEWTMKDNSAALPPVSPVKPEGYPEVIQLVPYGSARLRITEFPFIDAGKIEDVIK
jgi:hypothetical protein